MIKIIGTTHLMPKEEIDSILKKENPELIAVELCKTRFDLMVMPLINNTKISQEKKEDSTLVEKISSAVKEKAEKENLQYGSDQINACLYAKENNIQLEFIDLDIMRTKELMEKLPEEEVKGFMNELLEFQKVELKDLQKEINEKEVLQKSKLKYPIAYEFLITIRDLYLLSSILKVERNNPKKKILVVVGKGHKKFLEEELK